MTTRRGFLGSILAAGFAPAFIGSSVLMPVRRILAASDIELRPPGRFSAEECAAFDALLDSFDDVLLLSSLVARPRRPRLIGGTSWGVMPYLCGAK